jgi:hypothetical protein
MNMPEWEPDFYCSSEGGVEKPVGTASGLLDIYAFFRQMRSPKLALPAASSAAIRSKSRFLDFGRSGDLRSE